MSGRTKRPATAGGQFAAELRKAVTGPLEALTGQEAGVDLDEAQKAVTGLLAGSGGPEEARRAAMAVVALLFRGGPVPAEWWRTPLGLLVGPLLPDAPLTQDEAAAILGVTRGTVAVALSPRRGTLARFDGPVPRGRGKPTSGRVSRSAVLARLARSIARQGTEAER
jgi:hypothetical protein